MKFESVNLVHVYYKPHQEKIPVGRIALKARKIYFEYDASFIKKGLDLSPFKLPLKQELVHNTDMIFDGLFGVFNDSLPDGWGRLLLDRTLLKYSINPASLSPLDRLCFVGNSGMGALCYEPEAMESNIISDFDLDKIASEIYEFQDKDNYEYVEELLELGGSSCGARPKILLRTKSTDWLVKFRSSIDSKDIGNIEYAYHLMASHAGLRLPEAKLFPSKKGGGYFGVQRFDRVNGESIHMHTLSGLLHADHRVPSLDYDMIMKTTMHLTRDIREVHEQYRLCVFNVLTHNRDDHAKNFSFLMDTQGNWTVSPAYDLTFSAGPYGEHCTMVMGEGKFPSTEHLLELAKINDIKQQLAKEIIDEVTDSVSKWNQFADVAGVCKQSKKMIADVISS